MAPRETENNAYAKFWGDKQRVLWYVMIFSEVVNYRTLAYPFGNFCDDLKSCCSKCLRAVMESYTNRDKR